MKQKEAAAQAEVVTEEKDILACCVEQTTRERAAGQQIELVMTPMAFCCGVWQKDGLRKKVKATVAADGTFEVSIPGEDASHRLTIAGRLAAR